MAPSVKVFISYSHEDQEFHDNLVKYLTNMQRQGEISTWTDRKITGGSSWRNEIDKNLEAADIVLLLVSPDFIHSEYCYDKEMGTALERHKLKLARVIPVYIRVTDVKGSIIEELQGLPTDRKPVNKWQDKDEAWKNVVEGLRSAIAEYSEARPMNELVTKNDTKPDFSEPHKHWLDDTEVTLAHRVVDKVKLSKIYVAPDLLVVNKNFTSKIRRSINANCLIKDSDLSIVVGEEQAGKTSLAKFLCRQIYESGRLAVYINGCEVRSANISALIEKRLGEQYTLTGQLKDSLAQNITIIIDDIHLHGLNKKHFDQLVSSLKSTYSTLVFFAKDTFRYVMPDYEELEIFDTYQINDFGNFKRAKLIERWVSLGVEESLDEAEMYKECDEITTKINSIIRKKLIPSKPIFILSILQMLEAYTSQRLDMTSHGHCYQSLVYQALERIDIKQKEIDKYMNVMTEFAWAQYKNEGKAFTTNALAEFYDGYAQEYLSVDRTKVTEDLHKCNILSSKENLVSFKYPYIYYFFAAKKIADSFSKSELIKTEIKKLLEGLHREDYANIIIFITHHTKESWILDEIEMCLMQLFSDHTPATLQAQDTAFLEEFLKEIPKLVIEERKIQEEREKHQHSLEAEQENEIDITGPQPEDRDDNSLFANINKVFKGSELIGQIVRNRHASLNKSELSTLLKESYNCGLRFLQFFIDISDIAKEEVIQTIAQQIRENPSQTNLAIEKEARGAFLLFTYSAIYAVVRKIASSTGCVEAEEIYRAIESETPTPAIKLINQAIELDFHKKVDHETLERLANEFKGNIVCDRILKEIVIQHIYMFPVEYRDKQKISSYLSLPMEKLQLQDLDKRSKMLDNKK
ncbi:TIR domain-containing protein [Pseudomonas capeferrum]|uniref:TIR domain-containing protein n=1 Tax=Pseudomonas capeferrum TaxID=1495066 RepID=UPI0005347EE3|nr:TIR domain-containing protein [Pseudomonas capeferrum]MCH7297653.1 TIR domain-containing protein [Pseudomonas capeferrum]